MSVENPWMSGSPAPLMSHSEGALPGFEFSHATALRTGAHGSAALAVGSSAGTGGNRQERCHQGDGQGKDDSAESFQCATG